MSPARAVVVAVLLVSSAFAQQPVVTAAGENQRILSQSVSGSGNRWTVSITVDHDNSNASLPTSWRRWWHFQVRSLDPSVVTTLDFRILSAGYSDVILPVWSRSTDLGQSFGAYQRLPTSATPQVAGSTHQFTVQVPVGVTDIRVAKYFPYTVSDKDGYLARIKSHPHVRSVRSLGTSWQGRGIELVEITDAAVPDSGKRRVWIHAGIHPSESTSYFAVEGLCDFLLSGSPDSELLLDHLIFDVVPMANPDGVFLGNYRTNSRSANLEDEWVAPYNSPEREVAALRSQIEAFMGTAASPGQNPIEVLLNLHSSHNVAFPFHFEHVSNPSFNLVSNRTGVVPEVNAKERAWIAALKQHSPFVALGATASSTLGAPTRPFVESMMHDRWSIDPTWLGSPPARERVMAITLEGTYGKGPDRVTWNTDGDYRDLGVDLCQALGDYFGLLPGASITSYGQSCGGPTLSANLGTNPSRLNVTMLGGTPLAPLWFVIGLTEQTIPLPPCTLRTDPIIVLGATVQSAGLYSISIPLPPLPLSVKLHTVVYSPPWTSSNGLAVTWVP